MTTHETSIPPGSESAPVVRASFETSRGARLAAVQALFQIRSTQQATLTVIQEFIDHRFQSGEYPHIPDTALFKKLVLKVIDREDDLVRLIDAHLSEPWTCSTLEPVLREIILSGALELLEPLTRLPAPVIISEYIDLTHGFLSTTEAQLTNAVLDGIARALGLQLKKEK